MNWRGCIRIFARQGWVILFSVALAIMIAFVQSATQKPMYQAIQHVSLQTGSAATNSVNLIKYTPDAYTSWLGSLEHASQIADALQLDMAPHELRAAISITLDKKLELLSITVEMEDAAAAGMIARTYGANFVHWINAQNQARQDLEHVNAALWEYPEVVIKEAFTVSALALNGLIGAVLGFAIIYGRAAFDRITHRIQL